MNEIIIQNYSKYLLVNFINITIINISWSIYHYYYLNVGHIFPFYNGKSEKFLEIDK